MNLIVKQFEDNDVEIIEIEGQILFNPHNVGEVLEIADVRSSIRDFDEKQVKKITNEMIQKCMTMHNRKLHSTGELFLTEDGLYLLILRSRKPQASKFKQWITNELLPFAIQTSNVLSNIEFKGNVDGLVYAKNGIATTTSVNISSVFERNHREILRAIDTKLQSNNNRLVQFCTDHIKEINYFDSQNKIQRQYELDESGFAFIALSLTGEKADLFKIKYINAFDKMKKAIENMFKARVIESVLPQDNRNRQFIYIVKNPLNETIKIGVAQNVDKRIKQLQTGAGIELELIYHSFVCSNAFSIEKEVHSKFEEYRTFGEWFKINPEIVVNFLEQQTFVLKSEFMKQLTQ